jgi:hypothetical protein
MRWIETTVETPEGLQKAVAPEVISASRSTDIPAFYAEWFMNRLQQGYVKWVNPFNRRPQYVAFSNARVIIFWSKNPRPLMPFLDKLDRRSLGYYFHFTLNDYEFERLEPGVPPLADRIETFKTLSQRIGKHRVIWRFDPLILAQGLAVPALLNRIERVGDQLAPFTQKLVFSFADISTYRKVQNNLARKGIAYQEFRKDLMVEAAQGIGALAKQWGIAATTCAEPISLSQFGIQHNRCIDDDLILRITPNPTSLNRLFGLDLSPQHDLFGTSEKGRTPVKDPGQRASCGCVFGKDIGQYNTCPHLCLYCYANTSEDVVKRNASAVSPNSESILADLADVTPNE